MADFLFSVESLANYFSGLKKSKTFSCCKTKIGFTFFNNENHIFLSLSLSLSLLIFGGIFFIRNIVDFIIQMDDLWSKIIHMDVLRNQIFDQILHLNDIILNGVSI